MDPIVIGVIAIVIVLIGLAIAIALRGAGRPAEFQAIIKSWGEVAKRASLKFTAPETDLAQAQLAGSFHRREVAISLRVHALIGASGDRQTIMYTQIHGSTRNSLRHFIRISKKGAYRKTDRMLGAPYESMHDAEIDRRFDVKCIPPGVAARAIAASPEFRKRLLNVKVGGYVELEVEGTDIRFEQEGLILDAAYLMGLLELMNASAEAVEQVK